MGHYKVREPVCALFCKTYNGNAYFGMTCIKVTTQYLDHSDTYLNLTDSRANSNTISKTTKYEYVELQFKINISHKSENFETSCKVYVTTRV